MTKSTNSATATARVLVVMGALYHLGLEMFAGRLDVPDGVLVLTVVRGEEVLLARGKTRVQPGDLLLLLVESEQAFGRIKELVNRA